MQLLGLHDSDVNAAANAYMDMRSSISTSMLGPELSQKERRSDVSVCEVVAVHRQALAAMLCYAMLCYAMLRHATLRDDALRYAVRHQARTQANGMYWQGVGGV